MQVIYNDTAVLCNGFRTWTERRDSDRFLEFVGRIDQPARTIQLSLALLRVGGRSLLGVPAVLAAMGNASGLLGAIARRLNRKPVHLLIAPVYRLIAASRARGSMHLAHLGARLSIGLHRDRRESSGSSGAPNGLCALNDRTVPLFSMVTSGNLLR